MKVSRTLCTTTQRQEILNILINNFQNDSRIAAVIIVGSGAYGFEDEFSDIDLAIVTFDNVDLMTLLKDWKEKIWDLLEIIQSFEEHYSPTSLLLGFLTEQFLELDIGFQDIHHIAAKREHWRIGFDKTNELQDRMKDSWEQIKKQNNSPILEYHVNSSWHHITCALIALYREKYWRVLTELDNLKRDLMEIIALRYSIKVNRFLDSEQMTKELQNKLQELLVTKLNKEELFTVIKKLTELYYEEARKTAKQLGDFNFEYLVKRMSDYMQLMENRLFANGIDQKISHKKANLIDIRK